MSIQGMRPISQTSTGSATKPSLKDRVLVAPGTYGVERLVLNNPTYKNKVTLHVSPDDSRNAILDSIKNAKSSFCIEIFIWHNDASGREIAQALIDRKKLAVERGEPFDANVLIDFSGLRDATNPTDDTKIVEFLRDNGINVREFNRGIINPLATGRTPITHRKLFIADGKQFISGGRNIGDEYLQNTFFNPKKEQETAWHDLMYTVEGEETGRILHEFYRNWKRAGGEVPAVLPKVEPVVGGGAWVQSYTTNPIDKTTGIRDVHVKAIANAQSEIRVVYPYFSDDAMIDALIAAKKANPKLSIKVMLPGRGERGIPGFLYANLNLETARQLMAAGIEVRMIENRHVGTELVQSFSHFKAMVFDGKLMSIGSANGDARTMTSNHELNTLIYDPKVAKNFIDTVLEDDWQLAKPVTQADLTNRPWWKKVLCQVLEGLDFLF